MDGISTLVGKLNTYKVLAVALFFVGISLLGLFDAPQKGSLIEEKSTLEQPVQSQGNIIISSADAANTAVASIEGSAESQETNNPSGYDTSRATVLDSGAIMGGVQETPPSNNETGIPQSTQPSVLPDFSSEFIIPTKGFNWGILHNNNAVDIANSCGTPVIASASGIVITDPHDVDLPDGWNGGYGNFVLLEHGFGNGVLTRYAHLEKMFVKVGDYVTQGQRVGLMGRTGEATGCHLHFEIIGARNPFAKS